MQLGHRWSCLAGDPPAPAAARPWRTTALANSELAMGTPLAPAAIWPTAPWTGKVRHVELKVSTRSQGGRTIMSLDGEIDLYTAPRLHGELVAILSGDEPVQVVVDMSGIEFCDSTGMNVLLAAQRSARERGGDLELAAPRPAVRKVLQVTGLESVFTVLDDPATVAGQ
jgi:anti-sigma B factor antagonist